MKSSIRHFSSTGRKVAMALAFASLISGLSISSAFAARDDGRGQGARHGDHDRRDQHGNRGGHENRPEYRRSYNYAQPVYIPPPVYYEPQQSPGITFFFPLDLRR